MGYIITNIRSEYANRETGNREIIASVVCDDAASLPVQRADQTFVLSSDALDISTGDRYIINSSGQWILQPSDNAWQNVYTKFEIDNILTGYYTAQEIDTKLLDYYDMTQVDEKLTHKSALAFSPAGTLSSLINCTCTIPDSTRTLRFTIGKLNATTNYLQIYVNGVDKGYITFDVSRNIDNWGE